MTVISQLFPIIVTHFQLTMAEYCLNADDQTCTGSDSWDNKLRTPPRPRQDIALRDEIPTTQELLRQMVIAATTGTGPVQYAGMTPKGLLKRKRSEAEKKKLAEANAKNDNEDIGPKKKKQKLRFSGILSSISIRS